MMGLALLDETGELSFLLSLLCEDTERGQPSAPGISPGGELASTLTPLLPSLQNSEKEMSVVQSHPVCGTL